LTFGGGGAFGGLPPLDDGSGGAGGTSPPSASVSSSSLASLAPMTMPLKTMALALRAATWRPLLSEERALPAAGTTSSASSLMASVPLHFPFFLAVARTALDSLGGIFLLSRRRTGLPSSPDSQKKKKRGVLRLPLSLLNAALTSTTSPSRGARGQR